MAGISTNKNNASAGYPPSKKVMRAIKRHLFRIWGKAEVSLPGMNSLGLGFHLTRFGFAIQGRKTLA